ncbi:MAG: hypothetical protein Q8O85_16445 [Rhodoferax sp.]|nr:hypothetical protein [Rhodoferax sp.]MDP2680291.1 hypothetical protein [Rhodoferax sp.]
MNAAFTDALRGKYQCYTEADLGVLRATGFDHDFADVQTGVANFTSEGVTVNGVVFKAAPAVKK